MPPEYDARWDRVTGLYIDRQGEPCSLRRWVEIGEDDSLRHIAADYVRSSQGLLYVSTIWTGHDLSMSSYFGGRPLFYETMTFKVPRRPIVIIDEGCCRWSSLLEATAGHQMIAERLAQSWWTNLGGLA